MTINMEIIYLDTCLPDYFQGFSGQVLAVPCSTRCPRTHEIKTGLLRELSHDGIDLLDVNPAWGLAEDEAFDRAVCAVHELFKTTRMFSRWSSADSLIESYVYFGVVITETPDATDVAMAELNAEVAALEPKPL